MKTFPMTSPFPVSENVSRMQPSSTLAAMQAAQALRAAGAYVVDFGAGDPDFLLTADQVAGAITPRTKLLILNSPSNPSGRVLPPAEFKHILELTADRGIYVISDECYLRFVYPPAEVFSAATLPAELRSR